VDGATKGLEALLKATYGALFNYLVSRINDSISFQRESDMDGEGSYASNPSLDPAASIGVLDIFGFESFQINSFEQLCINYCNEALQQQFNAFVLKNEQAEYEREGINWSFIEFPENQDVLDLIDKRGSGILGILDDQCRAPGTSDKSFALDVYNKCKNQQRFSVSRKQTATLQFCVHHYAGPVEYTTHGFIEKNRDELPKEATELLQNSFNPFIQMLAEIIELTSSELGATKRDTPARLRHQDSAMARITVGGQFRRQLKHLREKIDQMSPHYVRCLKPNDELLADRFNRAAVAEQLRCGGILEAVRVARAGFSNHYPHEDFYRRYRCLAVHELENIQRQSKWESPPDLPGNRTSYRRSVGTGTSPPSSDINGMCQELIKILYSKVKTDLGSDENNNENDHSGSGNVQQASEMPSSLDASASFQQSRSSWAQDSNAKTSLPPRNAPVRGSRASAWEKKVTESRSSFGPVPSKPRASMRSGGTGGISNTELAKAGIQVGKTKVFLRHSIFEALERLRSQELGRAADKINSVMRMYLARRAYVDVRNMVRQSMHELIRFENEYKESKEQDFDDNNNQFARLLRMRNSYCGEQPSLVEVWATHIRSGIHNPVPRNQWGTQSPTGNFKWMLVDGLWVKNEVLSEIEY
jgi:myosin heavy subunit